MTVEHWSESLPGSACSAAVVWARTQPDAATAWAVCERGDWMLWIAGYYAGAPWSEARRPLVLAACECVEVWLPDVGDEVRSTITSAVQTWQAWAHGEATREQVLADRDALDALADLAARADLDAARGRQYADIVRRHYPSPPRRCT